MSFLSWFSKKARANEATTAPATDILPVDLTLPMADALAAAPPPPLSDHASRKSERHGRRELLYGVVRDSMNAAGLLSSSYKFKVLTLDSSGRKFLIMVDIPIALFTQLATSADMEAAIARRAKDRHDLLVSAVYWRVHEQVTQPRPLNRADMAPSHVASAAPASAPIPSPAPAPTSRPAVATAPAAEAVERSPQAQALEAEVLAFKQARAAGATSPVGLPDAESKEQSVSESGDFEDTVAFEHVPTLGPSQYGDLPEA